VFSTSGDRRRSIWRYGASREKQKNLQPLLKALEELREGGLIQGRSQDPKTDGAGLAFKRPNQQGHNIKMAREPTTMHILIYNLHYKIV
jgi:hypothetical protein